MRVAAPPVGRLPRRVALQCQRLCFWHWLLPLLVGPRLLLLSRVPLLCPHYQASSLVLTRLPFDLASSAIHCRFVDKVCEAQLFAVPLVPSSVHFADASHTNVGCATEASQSLLSMALSKIQRGARLLDPSRRFHLLEDLQSAFDQPHALPCLVTLSKATVGKQRLGQFGRALDLL